MAEFGKLVRFKDASGSEYYGEAEKLESITKDSLIGSSVPVYAGLDLWDSKFTLTAETRTVAEVLAPLPRIPIIFCVGMNYNSHAKEAGKSLHKYPLIFAKPPDALAGPFEDISIHPTCQEQMDYEVEMAIVIGEDCKNVTEDEDAYRYVLGYTVGNDVSARWWQAPERANGQPAAAKSFDKFAPLGPVITSKRLIPDPERLTVKTFVSGEQRQSGCTDDWIFNVPYLIRHLSRGTTLRRGTVILTGTPSGVAYFMKPQAWLQDGDVLETEVENIGKMENRIVFEK